MENVGLWNSRNSEHYINSCGTTYGAAGEGKKYGNITIYAGGNNGVACVLLNTVRRFGWWYFIRSILHHYLFCTQFDQLQCGNNVRHNLIYVEYQFMKLVSELSAKQRKDSSGNCHSSVVGRKGRLRR